MLLWHNRIRIITSRMKNLKPAWGSTGDQVSPPKVIKTVKYCSAKSKSSIEAIITYLRKQTSHWTHEACTDETQTVVYTLPGSNLPVFYECLHWTRSSKQALVSMADAVISKGEIKLDRERVKDSGNSSNDIAFEKLISLAEQSIQLLYAEPEIDIELRKRHQYAVRSDINIARPMEDCNAIINI